MAHDFQRPFTLPPGATELVLVRHGSSLREEGESMVGGRRDPVLSPDGHTQAEAVARRLTETPVAAMFVTPLQRTSQTAAPLAAVLGQTPEVVEELREVCLGDREQGHNAAAERDEPRRVSKLFEAGRWDVIPNAENHDVFADRVRRGIEHIADATGADATAVVVTHAGVIAEACRQITGSDAFAFLYSDNGSLTRLFRLASGRWALRCFNDTAHLEAVPVRVSAPARSAR